MYLSFHARVCKACSCAYACSKLNRYLGRRLNSNVAEAIYSDSDMYISMTYAFYKRMRTSIYTYMCALILFQLLLNINAYACTHKKKKKKNMRVYA